MLDFPDTAEVVIAVGTDSRVVGPVFGAARVVVNSSLVVEIQDVECAIGPDAGVDRAEPEIGAGHEFGIGEALHARCDIGGTGRLDDIQVNDVQGRLGDGVGVVVLGRPCAAVVDASAGRGGPVANPIDLHVGEEDFAVGSDINTPSVAALGGELLNRGTITLETDDTVADFTEVFGAVT